MAAFADESAGLVGPFHGSSPAELGGSQKDERTGRGLVALRPERAQ